jgi:hypothetical protein
LAHAGHASYSALEKLIVAFAGSVFRNFGAILGGTQITLD